MHHGTRPAIALPADVRPLLEAPNYVHLSTLRADGRPRNHVVWVGLEGERVLICTPDWTWKAKDMRRDLMDPISIKYTGAPFPSRGPDRSCFVIAVEHAVQHTLNFVHRPGAAAPHQP